MLWQNFKACRELRANPLSARIRREADLRENLVAVFLFKVAKKKKLCVSNVVEQDVEATGGYCLSFKHLSCVSVLRCVCILWENNKNPPRSVRRKPVYAWQSTEIDRLISAFACIVATAAVCLTTQRLIVGDWYLWPSTLSSAAKMELWKCGCWNSNQDTSLSTRQQQDDNLMALHLSRQSCYQKSPRWEMCNLWGRRLKFEFVWASQSLASLAVGVPQNILLSGANDKRWDKRL